MYCYSKNLNRNMTVKIYGVGGLPILVFPTQDAMSDNFENFGMIDALDEFIKSGKIQLFCVDTIDTETWSNVFGDKIWRANRQESYYNYIIEEVLPLIHEKNSSGKLPVAAGCSLGGLHAAIVFFRRPELFSGILSLSGVYDAKFFLNISKSQLQRINSMANLSAEEQNECLREILRGKIMPTVLGVQMWKIIKNNSDDEGEAEEFSARKKF